MFGEIAGKYDLLNHLLSLNIDRWWRRRTVGSVPPRGNAPILDLCTGTGDLALAYYKATGGRVPIVAADFCHPMLIRGIEKGRRQGVNGQMMFVEADAQRLPLPDDRFQIVCVAFGLRNVTDTDRGLAEMVRVCRPGGTVAVLEFSQPTYPVIGPLYGWYFRHVLPRIGQWLARNRNEAYITCRPAWASFPAARRWPSGCERRGWPKCAFRPLTFGVATLYVGTKPQPSQLQRGEQA